jgi:hypothetical protein
MGIRRITNIFIAALCAVLFLTGARIAQAGTVSYVAGFEGLPTGNGASGSPVGTYDGLTWSGLNAYDASRLPNAFTGSGIETGSKAAYNNGGGAISITLATGDSFALTSLYISEAKSYGSTGLQIALIGYGSAFASGSSKLIYTMASDASPSLFSPNWTGLTRLDMYAVDSTGKQISKNTATEFRLDDVRYSITTGSVQPVPEPSTWIGFGAALVGIGLMVRSRQRLAESL